MAILLLPDSQKTAKEISQDLINLDYEVLVTLSSDLNRQLIRNANFIIVDASRGLRAKLDLIKKLKDNLFMAELPLLVLISESDLSNLKVVDELIDDFIVYPYNLNEVKLRLKMVWQKTGVKRDSLIKIEGLTIDLASYEVNVDGEPVSLTYKEFELLKFLALHPRKVHTRQQLAQKIWQYEHFVGTRTVDVHIRRLRSKLGRYESLINTVRNVGYKFG